MGVAIVLILFKYVVGVLLPNVLYGILIMNYGMYLTINC